MKYYAVSYAQRDFILRLVLPEAMVPNAHGSGQKEPNVTFCSCFFKQELNFLLRFFLSKSYFEIYNSYLFNEFVDL
jgi:hypothetical protein